MNVGIQVTNKAKLYSGRIEVDRLILWEYALGQGTVYTLSSGDMSFWYRHVDMEISGKFKFFRVVCAMSIHSMYRINALNY